MNEERRNNTTSFTRLTLTLFLIGAYPLLGMLWHHDYPVLSAEVASLLIGLAVLSAGLVIVLRKADWLALNLILVTLLTLALMVHSNLAWPGVAAVWALALVVSMLFRNKFPASLIVVLGALIAGAFADTRLDLMKNTSPIPASASHHSEGPLIHIVVDGFIAPDGLPRSEQSENLRQDVVDFFLERDFELHTRAYSHYNNTMDSLTRAFNFRNDEENVFQRLLLDNSPLTIRENAWFSSLSQQGYSINVYQTEGFDFCRSEAVDRCRQYTTPNLKTVHQGIDNIPTRISALLRTLLGQSTILKGMLSPPMRLSTWGVSTYDRSLLIALASDMQTQGDHYYFAHLLIPHPPLVYRQDCSLDYQSEPWLRFTASDGLIGNSPETRAKRYPRYIAQSKCALRELADLFQALKDQGLYQRSTIIVHGDHGSMAYNVSPIAANMNTLRYRDLRESYSTLFAVKFPASVAALQEDVESLNILLARTLVQITGQSEQQLGIELSSEEEPFIYLSGVIPLQRMFVNVFTRDPEDPQSEE